MASRFYARFKSLKKGRSGGVVKPGEPGDSPDRGPVTEKTAAWPTAGASGPMPFNQKTRWPVVKTAAKKEGIC